VSTVGARQTQTGMFRGYTWRMALADATRAMVPGGMMLNGISRMTGGWMQRGFDRMWGATADRTAYQAGRGGGLGFSGLGGFMRGQPPGAPLPGWMMPGAPMPGTPLPYENGQQPAFHFADPSGRPAPDGGQQHGQYGGGLGMMRAPAPPPRSSISNGSAVLAQGAGAQDFMRSLFLGKYNNGGGGGRGEALVMQMLAGQEN
jgi:hypothetical protein